MNVYFITFRSVTLAQRGEGLLTKNGIRCSLQRTPRWMEEQGCGYCLRLKKADVTRALELLRQNKVPLRRIYVQGEDGNLKELAL